VWVNLIYYILVFHEKNIVHITMQVNLIHSKLVFLKKIVKKINKLEKKNVNSAKWIALFTWTVQLCVSHVETRKKTVKYCFWKLVVLKHINGGTHVFLNIQWSNQTTISYVFEKTQTLTRCQTSSKCPILKRMRKVG